MKRNDVQRISSEILSVKVDRATYHNAPAVFRPTYINYFYGNNGTGKSSVVKSIQSGNGVQCRDGKNIHDYNLLVFNREYIENNLSQYHGIAGVYTIGRANKDLNDCIEAKTEEYHQLKEEREKIKKDYLRVKNELDALPEKLRQTCWKETEPIRTMFEKTQEGKKKSQPLTEEILRSEPANHDMQELQQLYAAAFESSNLRYSTLPQPEPEDIVMLDHFPGEEILETAIVNTADTDFARFTRKLAASEWVREGRQTYLSHSNGRCPFCYRPIPDELYDMLSASFDETYTENMAELNAFLEDYQQAANELYDTFSSLPGELHPSFDYAAYHSVLAELKKGIQKNISSIQKKVRTPALAVALSPVSPAAEQLAAMALKYNKTIADHNRILASRPEQQRQCTRNVFELMAYRMQETVAASKTTETDLNHQLEQITAEGKKIRERINSLQAELQDLNRQVRSTDAVRESINSRLRDYGFQGFELRQSTPDSTGEDNSPHAGTYDVVRTETGELASDLSEGEKNFLAFAYFYSQVFGQETEEDDYREKIVLIDDPISSLDRGILFAVSAMVRNMIEVCRNNVDDRESVIPGNFIKQIFIFTHNVLFHQQISVCYPDCWDFTAFFLITKVNNRSNIRECDDVNPNAPTMRINVNPVKNPYIILWDQYRNAKTYLELINSMRQILEAYFIQLSSYDGKTLHHMILEDPENKKILIRNDDGSEDFSRYQIASAILSYVAANTFGVTDGICYSGSDTELDACRKTLQKIFTLMGQEQHYHMMMKAP